MKLFYDIFETSQEKGSVLSDAYKLESVYGGYIYKVQSRMKKVGQTKVDVGCGDAFSGEKKQAQQPVKPAQEVVDIIDGCELQVYNFTDSNDFLKYFKNYVKNVLAKINEKYPIQVEGKPQNVQNKKKQEDFKKNIVEFTKYVRQNFKDFVFYVSSTYNSDYVQYKLVIPSEYEEGAKAPTFYYVVDGLKEVKF